MDRKKVRVEIFEVKIPASGKEFSLGSIPNLRDAKFIYKVEALPNAQATKGPSGLDNIADAVFNKSYLVLINSSNVKLREYSLNSIAKTVNGSTIQPCNCPAIDPEKSKIVIAETTGIVAGTVVLLQFEYEAA